MNAQRLDKRLQLANLLASSQPGNLDDVEQRVEYLAELMAHLQESTAAPPASWPCLHEAAMHALYEGKVRWLRRGHYRAGVVPHNDVVIIARKPRGLPAELEVRRLADWLAEVHATCTGRGATATILRELAQRVEEYVAASGNLYERCACPNA